MLSIMITLKDSKKTLLRLFKVRMLLEPVVQIISVRPAIVVPNKKSADLKLRKILTQKRLDPAVLYINYVYTIFKT